MAREIPLNFCSACGGKLRQLVDGPPRLICSGCSTVHHLDPKLAAAGIILRNGKVLLVKRARPPQKGKWCLPGGFVDRGEMVESAVAREVEEETGLQVRPLKLFGLYSYEGDPIVVAIFETEILGGEIHLTEECQEIKWFDFESVPFDELAFPSARDSMHSLINLQ